MHDYSHTIGLEKSIADTKAVEAAIPGTIHDLTKNYKRENVSFDSLALYLETKYIEMREQEKYAGNHPTRFKTAVCADLMMKLCQGLGRYSSVSSDSFI